MYKILFITVIFILSPVYSCPKGKTEVTCDEYHYNRPEDRSNILSNIPDDKKIGHLSLTGTHNSMSYTTPNPKSQTQELNITEQLHAGVRVMDVGVRTMSDSFIIYSGTVSMHRTFRHIIDPINEFLDYHPREFVIIILRQEYRSPQDELHPSNCKILNDYLEHNAGWRLTKNWSLDDTIDKAREKILLTTNDIAFFDCLSEPLLRCSHFTSKDSSGYDFNLSIIDNFWNNFIKYIEKNGDQDYVCHYWHMVINSDDDYPGRLAKYAGFSFKDQCVEPLNNKLYRLYPGSHPSTLTIVMVNYVTTNIISRVHEINMVKFKNSKSPKANLIPTN